MELDALAGRSILDEVVPTPLVYVDREVLERNVRAMAEAARRSGVGLRPHAKTHKIAEIARLQLAAGASGLTVAKLAEAQAFVEAGISTSFMIAQPYVGPEKTGWQIDLAQTCETIASIDSLELGRVMSEVATRRTGAVDLVLIVDTGYGRFGVVPDEAPGLADRLATLPGVRFRGIRSHSGAAYGATTEAAREAIALDDARVMSEVAREIVDRGLPCEIVSVGSTPGLAGLGAPSPQGVTEWRPGNYVFFDRMQMSLGVATLEECALRVVASVVSTPAGSRALVDAGRKTLSATADPHSSGYGLAVGSPGIEICALSEECGWVQHHGELRIGDRLELIPNHACEVTNLVEAVAYGAGGIIEGFWTPAARGKVW